MADETERGAESGPGKGLRIALTFGIVAATIEIGIVLWMMYC